MEFYFQKVKQIKRLGNEFCVKFASDSFKRFTVAHKTVQIGVIVAFAAPYYPRIESMDLENVADTFNVVGNVIVQK